MSNRKNHRRGEKRRTENGPRWENSNLGKGCNSTHVARARRWWRKYGRRFERKNGRSSPNVHFKGRPRVTSQDDSG